MVGVALAQKSRGHFRARSKTARPSRSPWTAKPSAGASRPPRAARTAKGTTAAFGFQGLPLVGREGQMNLPGVRQAEKPPALQARRGGSAGNQPL